MRDDTRRIAVNIAKLPELLQRPTVYNDARQFRATWLRQGDGCK
jgi:hypothetical protein